MSDVAGFWGRSLGWWLLAVLLLLSGCATGAPLGGLLGDSWRPRPLVPAQAPHSREEYRAEVARREEAARWRWRRR